MNFKAFLGLILVTVMFSNICCASDAVTLSPNADIENIEDIKNVKNVKKIENIKNLKSDLSENDVSLRPFDADEASGSVEEVTLYSNDNNLVAALLLCSDTLPADTVLTVNGNTYTINDEPDLNGYIYLYFNDLAFDGNEVEVLVGDNKFNVTPVDVVTSNDSWTLSDDKHSLLLYNGTNENVVVPNMYDGNIITGVGGYINNNSYKNILFGNNDIKDLKSVVFSDGITFTEAFAFENIEYNFTISLPKTLECIYLGTFYNSGVTGDIELPDSMLAIDNWAFTSTPITGIEFNNGLKYIGDYAFKDCNKITKGVSFPETLYYIGSFAFMSSTVRGSITIPRGVEKVKSGLFYNCKYLSGNLVLEEGVKEIEHLAFGADGAITTGFTSLSLPSTLKTIGTYAFQFCNKVENLTLPEGLETISDGAFDHMSGLTNTKITIPASVTTIGGNYNVTQNTGYGGHIFYDMGKNDTFKEFEVADGNEYFTAVDGVLYSKDMTRMLAYPRGKTDEKFEIPEGITQIDEMAFSRAAYLKTVVLPDSYTIITDIPSNILNQEGNSLSIGLYVYTSVNYVDVKDSNEKYVSIDGVIYSKDKKTLWYVPNQKSGKIDIQDGCEKIEKGGLYAASMSNTGWTAINVPASVTDIDTDVFDELNSYFAGYVTVDNNKYYKINTEKCSYELFDNNKQLAAVLLKHLSGIKQENVSKQFETADLRDVIALLKEENE